MRKQNAELVNIRRLAEGAVLVAAFTAMAFQYIRMELFETEKNAILGILAALILGANVIEFVHKRQFPKFRNPLVIAVLAMVFAGLVSTIFSFSPTYSLWGSPTRAHGLVILIIYALIFWQATRSGQRLQEGLFAILVMTSISMCVWAIKGYYFPGDGNFNFVDRPSSTAGNPNYLAGWITMFLLYFVSQVFWRLRQWDWPFSRTQWSQLVFFAIVFVINILTFIILASRGAFAGFAAGFGAAVIIYLSYYKRRVLLAITLVVVTIAMTAYVLISQSYSGRNPDEIGFARIFVPYDESRDVLWQTAIKLIRRSTEPFPTANGGEDSWAFLRPAVGYGLETLEQTQIRFGEPFESSRWTDRFVERFHNLFFDWIIEAGTLGLLAILAIYQTAIYIAMRKLRFIYADQIWYWLGLQLIGIPAGVWLTTTVIPRPPLEAMIPLGAAVGTFLATLVWIARSGFLPDREEDAGRDKSSQDNLTVVAILCIIFAQWMDNQFGFMQIMSQTLFFIMLGLLVALSDTPDNVEIPTEDEEPESIPESRYWYGGTLIAGLFLIYGMGIAVDSGLAQAAIETNYLPTFLIILFIAGIIAFLPVYLREQNQLAQSVSSKQSRKRKKKKTEQVQANPLRSALTALGTIAGIWIVFFAFKYGLVQTASSSLDSALTNRTGPSASGIQGAYFMLSLNGIVLMIIAVAVFYWLGKGREKFALFGLSSLVVAGFFFVGIYYYSHNFSVGTMRRTAQGFTNEVDGTLLQPVVAADVIYQRTEAMFPADVKLRINHIDNLMKQIAYYTDPRIQADLANLDPQILAEIPNRIANAQTRIEQQIAAARDIAPFFVNSKTWQVFMARMAEYERQLIIAGQQPISSPPAFAAPPGQFPPGVESLPPGVLPPGVEPQDIPPFLLPTANPSSGGPPPGVFTQQPSEP